MDLLTYLKTYEPQELIHIAGNVYGTRTHSSLQISNGAWMWWAQNIGGYTALDYLIKVENYRLPEAVERILGENLDRPIPQRPQAEKTEKPKVLMLPPVNRTATAAFNYLRRRGIDAEIIKFCISTGRLYESRNYGYANVVFIGRDNNGKERYACVRGIDSDFIGDANGSDKHYSFGIPAEAKSDTLNLFESAIDLLSHGTLLRLDGENWRTENLLSLAGVYKPKDKIEDSVLPAALKRYLAENPHIRKVVLRFDNDPTGRLAAKTIKALLEKDYAVTVKVHLSPQGKDYNDCLCMRLGIPITKRKEKSKER